MNIQFIIIATLLALLGFFHGEIMSDGSHRGKFTSGTAIGTKGGNTTLVEMSNGSIVPVSGLFEKGTKWVGITVKDGKLQGFKQPN